MSMDTQLLTGILQTLNAIRDYTFETQERIINIEQYIFSITKNARYISKSVAEILENQNLENGTEEEDDDDDEDIDDEDLDEDDK